MEQELSVFEDLEKVERAKKRGKAWLCLHCFNNSQKRWVDIKCRVEDHVMKYHLALEEVPFYCKLCMFRCQRKEQLVSHVTKYKRHVDMAAKSNIIDHSPCLVQNAKPHVMCSMDYKPLTAEESLQHFLGIRPAVQSSTSQTSEQVLETEAMCETDSESPIPATRGEDIAPALNTTTSPEVFGQIAALNVSTDVSSLSPTISLPTDGISLSDQLMSGQLTQLLSSIINNQQLLLTNCSNSLSTAGLLSQPVLGSLPATPARAQDLTGPQPATESTVSQEVVSQSVPSMPQEVVGLTVPLSTQGEEDQSTLSAEDVGMNQPVTQEAQEVVNQTNTQLSQDVGSKPIKELSQDVKEPETQTSDVMESQPLDLSVTVIASDSAVPSQHKVRSVPEKESRSKESEKNNVEEMPLDLSAKSNSSEGQDKEGIQVETTANERTDIRKVVVSRELEPATTEEYVPQYVPTPVEQLKEMTEKRDQEPGCSVETLNQGKDEHVLEDILQDEDMTISSPKKRGIEKEDRQTNYKRRKQDHSNTKLPVDIQGLSESTLVTVVDIFRIVMEKNAVAVRKMEEKLTENTVMMCKLIDGVTRLKNSIDEHEKEERRREDRRRDFENRREEERRRDISRWREEERRREEWRREAERKEREERRRKEEKAVDKDKSDKRKENQGDERAVLNESNNKQVERRGRRW